LKWKPLARGKRAPRAPSNVGWFCLRPWLGSAVGSVGPPVCRLALVAARAPRAVSGEDTQSDTRPATTQGGPAAVKPVEKSPRCDGPALLRHGGRSDSPVQ